MSTNEVMVYFVVVPLVIGIVTAFFIGKPEQWKLFFVLGAIFFTLSEFLMNFLYKSDSSTSVDSQIWYSYPILAIGAFFIGIANVLGYKFSKTLKK